MKDLDRMAMAAMQGLLSGGYSPTTSDLKKHLIELSYDLAEAMLEESKKRSKDEPIEMD